MNNRKKALAYYASLIVCLVLIFGLTAALYVLQKNEPVFTGTHTVPLFYALVAVAAVFLGIMLLFGKNAMKADIQYRREKLLAGSEPWVQSGRPHGDPEALIRQIQTDMQKDGFRILENVDLHPDAQTALAYRVKFNFARDYLTEYVFLIRCGRVAAYGIDFSKASEVVEGMTKKGFKLFRRASTIALCVFTDEVDGTLAKDVTEVFSKELLYIMAAYDLSTGRVYFMNGKDSQGSRFDKLQGLVRKYIVGE